MLVKKQKTDLMLQTYNFMDNFLISKYVDRITHRMGTDPRLLI